MLFRAFLGMAMENFLLYNGLNAHGWSQRQTSPSTNATGIIYSFFADFLD